MATPTFYYHLGDAHETANSERKFQRACRKQGERIQTLDIRVRRSFQNSVAEWDTSTTLQAAAFYLPNLKTFSMKLYPRQDNNQRDEEDDDDEDDGVIVIDDDEDDYDDINDNAPGLHKISSTALAALIQSAKKLTTLSLIHVGIEEDGILSLANAFRSHPALESVRLVDCVPYYSESTVVGEEEPRRASIGTRFLPVIESLTRIPTLQSVAMTKVVVIHEDYDPLGRLPVDVKTLIQRAFVELASAHSNGGCSLRCLAIKHCPCISLEDDMMALTQALEGHPTLKSWTLEPWEAEPEPFLYEDPVTNVIDMTEGIRSKFPEFMRVLGMSLQQNDVLEDVTVRYNDEDLMPIANALETNHTLKAFHFVGVGANRAPEDPQVIEKLGQLLVENYTLQHIGGPQAHGWSQDMAFYLLLNRVGRRSLLEKDPITGESARLEDWVQAVVANKEHVGVIFYLLSSDQSLIVEMDRQQRDAAAAVGVTTSETAGSRTLTTTTKDRRQEQSKNRKRRRACEQDDD